MRLIRQTLDSIEEAGTRDSVGLAGARGRHANILPSGRCHVDSLLQLIQATAASPLKDELASVQACLQEEDWQPPDNYLAVLAPVREQIALR